MLIEVPYRVIGKKNCRQLEFSLIFPTKIFTGIEFREFLSHFCRKIISHTEINPLVNKPLSNSSGTAGSEVIRE